MSINWSEKNIYDGIGGPDLKPDTVKTLQKYVEENIEFISDIVAEVEKELSKKEFQYFKSELGDYFNEL